ncbi:MAG: hypothetical protein U0840_22945 [Gemmataceae bacterium]
MRNLPTLGRLKQDPSIPEWWNSKPIRVPFCSGKAFPFCVRAEAERDVYPPDVHEAVRTFLNLTDAERLDASDRVYRYYREIASHVPEVDLGVTEPTRIWDHIRFTNVFVDRYDEADKAVYIRLVGECDWEQEHGFQMLFRNGSTISLVGEHEDGSFVEDDRNEGDEDDP